MFDHDVDVRPVAGITVEAPAWSDRSDTPAAGAFGTSSSMAMYVVSRYASD
jgi:hypothetical protein